MDTKTAKRLIHDTPIGGKVGKQILPRGDKRDPYVNEKENAIVEAIDNRAVLLKHADWLEKLRTGKADVRSFLNGVSPEVVIRLLYHCYQGAEKNRLAAIQDLLDRAGFSKLNKHAVVGSVDPEASKEALIAMLMGADKDLKEHGIDIINDEDEDKTKSPERDVQGGPLPDSENSE
jgi:hypothetical protein